ncbi:DUF262 domain-containing protein [Catellatospora chokoriensis]|uniref:GmrSD restriction endonucleases N-terminal domain-containing protein n=1 Tax=Catellatospora chokoriensis TaxID=310353 RepID=A0A8J3JS03_9ACTN|nr:DUF262 domain-containing protein [Catellatospora chokoriensis]GIF90017.1 hypothetical protein Cch02nite_34610 [Catellatospora chokoriensis]
MVPELGTLQTQLDNLRKAVDVDYFDLSLRELSRMVVEEEIRIAPEYQRQFRWKDDIQSALIESFLLGLPVPAIFVATNSDGTWEVVDGLQRICTILRFMGLDAPESEELHFAEKPLKLRELKSLTEFEGLVYEDFPRPIKLTFDKRYLRVQVLSDKSNTEIRFELFRRLNAGAVELTAQEVRACIFQGTFNTLLGDLAESAEFSRLLKLQSIDQRNGTAAEVALKFFAYLDAGDSFDGKVTTFLNKYMKANLNPSDLEEKRQLFMKVISFLDGLFGGEPFLRENTKVTPLNQLEAVLIGLGRIYRSGREPITPSAGWLDDEVLLSFSKAGTNTKKSLVGRVTRAEEIFSS